jgi:hypothetical protein
MLGGVIHIRKSKVTAKTAHAGRADGHVAQRPVSPGRLKMDEMADTKPSAGFPPVVTLAARQMTSSRPILWG